MDDKNWQLREGDLFASPQALSDERVPCDGALNEAAWAFWDALPPDAGKAVFNHIKPALKAAIEKWLDRRALLSHTAPQAEPTSEVLADMIPLGATILEPGTMESQPERKVCMTVKQLREFRRAASPVSAPAVSELRRIAYELRIYNPDADEYKGTHIHKVWANEIDSALTRPAQDDQSKRIAELEAALTNCRVKHEVACSTLEVVKEQRTIAQKALAGQCAETKRLQSQLSTARAEGYAEAIEAAAKVNDESGLQPAISKRIRALRCPEQTAEAPNLIDFHNGEAAIWIEDGQVKAEWNEPFVSAAQSDSKDALQKIAAMLEGYAASYETMARDKAASGMVACSCVAVDIRQNMLSFVNNLAALPQQSTDGGQPNA